MKKLHPTIFLILFLFLSGCAGNGALIPLTDKTLDAAGEVVNSAAGYTADASVAKQQAVTTSHDLRTQAIFKAHKNTGFKLKPIIIEKTVFYPGMKEPLIVKEQSWEMSYTPPIVFAQALPMEPAKHPVWDTVNNFMDNGFGFAKFFAGGYFINDGAKHIFDRAAPQYNGAYTVDSYNEQTAEPFFGPPMEAPIYEYEE